MAKSLEREFLQGSFPSGSHGHANESLYLEIRELSQRSRLQEQEILLLRKQINDASLNELNLVNEKHVLERTFCELQLALNDKQDNVISDTVKELRQKKKFLEKQSRLLDSLKMEEKEIHTFTSYLLSFLSQHNIRPPVLNASMITNGTQRLYRHMHSKLGSYDTAYKELHPHDNNQIDLVNATSNPSMIVQGNDGMDVKDVNAPPNSSVISPSNKDIGGAVVSNSDEGYVGGASDKNVDSEIHTPPKQLIPASTFQADPLPGIKELQILGEAKPGCSLQACGIPINGTTLVSFQWVREFENGTRQVIEGATFPEYVVTADDVDTYLAIECIPTDDYDIEGALVRCFANNQKKITCDSGVQGEIDKHISFGRATFNVLLLMDSSEWEPALLTLKRSSYHVKFGHTHQVLIDGTYSPMLYIEVPYGKPNRFVLVCSDGKKMQFSTAASAQPENVATRLRDIIVLMIRYFQSTAVDSKRKGKA